MSDALAQAVTAYIATHGNDDGVYSTAIDGLTLMRTCHTTLPNHLLYRPELCMVVQGSKSILLGDVVMEYGAMQALVASVELPGIGNVVQASAAQPLLVLALQLDVALLRETLQQMASPPATGADEGPGIYVLDVGEALADCFLRLLQLLAQPAERAMLLPLLLKEIYFRLLTGPHGDRLAGLAMPESRAQRLAGALHVLRGDFTRPVRIQELADAARMSVSSFHHHFKQLTSLSPLQYQKQLRLLEAKRLMVMEHANVTRAAFHVGYESASQFSREYVRLFGTSPLRDATAARKLYRMHAAAPF